MAGKQLTAHNAVITTASVEIKTLTVSGRQVTQALFRQLREEDLIAEDSTLNGVPWGWVNFHPDKCENRLGGHQHRHIVWQRGEDLLRSQVSVRPRFGNYYVELDSEGEWLLSDELVLRWLQGPPEASAPFDQSDVEAARKFGFGKGATLLCAIGYDIQTRIDYELPLSEKAERAALLKLRSDAGHPGWSARLPTIISELHEEVRRGRADEGRARAKEDLAAELKVEAARREKHAATHEALFQLPQLFIAT